MIGAVSAVSRPEGQTRLGGGDAFVIASCFFCLFSFKFKLLNLGETGVRLDDFLSLGILLVLLSRGTVRLGNTPRWLLLYVMFVSFGMLSSVIAWTQGHVELFYSLVFNVRLLQYLIFFYAGFRLSALGVRVDKWFLAYFIALLVLIPLQFLRIVPVPGDFDAARASGNTNGPYELAMLGSFLFMFPFRTRWRWLIQAGAYAIVMATASRITTLAVTGFVVAWLFAKLWRGSRPVKIASLGAAFIIAIVGAVLIDNVGAKKDGSVSILARFQSFDIDQQAELIGNVYGIVPIYARSRDYIEEAFNDAIEISAGSDTDKSANIRFIRWATLFKSSSESWVSIVFGLGPSFGSAAVDGYFTRVFVETGIIGLLLFTWFFVTLLRDRRDVALSGRRYFTVLLISAIFIDVFTSYKSMIFLWFWLGYCYQRRPLDAYRIRDAGRRA